MSDDPNVNDTRLEINQDEHENTGLMDFIMGRSHGDTTEDLMCNFTGWSRFCKAKRMYNSSCLYRRMEDTNWERHACHWHQKPSLDGESILRG